MHVVAVRAGDVGVVDDVDVALFDVFDPDGADNLRHGQLRDPYEGRQVELALRDELAVAVVEGPREVMALIHRRGVGGLLHDERHLVADSDEGVAQDLKGDRVDLETAGGSRGFCHADSSFRADPLGPTLISLAGRAGRFETAGSHSRPRIAQSIRRRARDQHAAGRIAGSPPAATARHLHPRSLSFPARANGMRRHTRPSAGPVDALHLKETRTTRRSLGRLRRESPPG